MAPPRLQVYNFRASPFGGRKKSIPLFYFDENGPPPGSGLTCCHFCGCHPHVFCSLLVVSCVFFSRRILGFSFAPKAIKPFFDVVNPLCSGLFVTLRSCHPLPGGGSVERGDDAAAPPYPGPLRRGDPLVHLLPLPPMLSSSHTAPQPPPSFGKSPSNGGSASQLTMFSVIPQTRRVGIHSNTRKWDQNPLRSADL